MHTDTLFLVLFIVATAVAVVARRLRLPYTIALVVAGLVLGQLHAFEAPHLTRDLLFKVFLPGLLFEAAFHFDLSHFRRDQALILSLAVPGVLAATVLTAVILVPAAQLLSLTQPITWQHALVFGTLIAATDPIAVVGLFRSLGAPARLASVLEGESLLNDGTAIVFFGLALGLAGGVEVTVSGVVLEFIRVVGIGVATGFVTGLTISTAIRAIDDPMIEITLTSIAAYGAFIAAEQIHGSGVMATVVAGMICGNYGARTGMAPTTRVAVETFWEYVAFALNSIVFLLIGFEVALAQLLEYWRLILPAFFAVLVGRAAVVYTAAPLVGRRDPVPPGARLVLSWGGLRGGLSMVLALSLPADFPNRGLLIVTTFGVVLLSILVQGLTMGPLLRRLGLIRSTERRIAYDLQRGRLQTSEAALAEVATMMRQRSADHRGLETLRAEYQERVTAAQNQLEQLRSERSDLHEDDLQSARRHLLMVEKAQAIASFREGLVSRDAYEKLLAQLDERVLQLNEGRPE